MSDFPFVWWRGTLMTRHAFAVLSALSAQDRDEVLPRLAAEEAELEEGGS